MKFIAFIYSIVALMFLGIAYAWSLFADTLQNDFEEWTTIQVSAVLSITMIAFCFAGLISGAIRRVLKRQVIVLICSLLFFIGMYLTSYTERIYDIYIFYGVINGFATGLCYNTVISDIPILYSKRKNFITGILMMSYGMSSMLLGPVIEWSNSCLGWRVTFRSMAYIYLIVMVLLALLLGKVKYETKVDGVDEKRAIYGELSLQEAVLTKPIWLYFAWGTCTACVGLGAIGHISQTAMEVTNSRNMAVIATGILSVSNGVSRVIFGIIYDKYERKIAMRILNIVGMTGIIIICTSIVYKIAIFLLIGACLLGSFYGGAVPIYSAFVREYYGEKYFSETFGFVCADGFVSSFLGPTFVSYVYTYFGSYLEAYATTAIYVIIAVILEMVLTLDYKKRQVGLNVFV